ncbi:molybdopterin molybdotransferase MoeA [Lewinella sp. IMCC34191]|uniref:molybdopterin molybdotransferase MoeA n=1 Tax=Lewinella sp. IMCC34191 TaxID=2259172 RepID=UPI0018E5321C|nr:molybdopterin molybdotransferase MoeA [Lewinella sp. IMCC34191]
MIAYPAALARTLEQTFDWGTERVPLAQATGRVLSQSVVADRDHPPFDRVAMDGVAIDFQAYAAAQRRFAVSHVAPAGTPPRPLAASDQCVEVMTGAPLPPGTTTVIRYEDIQRDGEFIVLPDGVTDARSIHRRATDARAGTTMLEGSRIIGPAEMAVLATYGQATVTVRRWPLVAIASTGDEVVDVDREPQDHQIRSSNVHQLASLFRMAGIQPTLSHLGDDPAGGRHTLGRLIDDHDVVLLSGGVSKGKLDHIPNWLADAGIEKLFHRVAQRPGKPLWVGRNEDTMVFALPGNPASSLVGAVVYVGAWLRQQLGVPVENRRALLAEDVSFAPELTLFRSVQLEHANGQITARPVTNSGSGDLVSLLETDGFLVLPADRTNFMASEPFPFVPLRFF